MLYTDYAPRRQQFHVAPAMYQPNSVVTTSVSVQIALCKATVTHLESHSITTCAQWICSEAETSAIAAIVKLDKCSYGKYITYYVFDNPPGFFDK